MRAIAWRCGFATTGEARAAARSWRPRCTTRSRRSATGRSCGWSTSPIGATPSKPPALLLLGPVAILADTHLVERVQQRAAQPRGHQGDAHHLLGEPAKRGGSEAGRDQNDRTAVSEDAPARGHAYASQRTLMRSTT